MYRVNFLRKKANRHLALAKKANAEGNKPDALLNLKRKKVFEKEIATLESSILTIEENVLRIEGSSAVVDVYDALQLAKNTMLKVTKGVDVDKLQDLMADLQDLSADHEEVQEILSSPVDESLDDPDLLEELEKLGAEELENVHFATAREENAEEAALLRELSQSTRELQELEELVVPTSRPVIKQKQPVKTAEDQELEELQAAMLA